MILILEKFVVWNDGMTFNSFKNKTFQKILKRTWTKLQLEYIENSQ